MSDTSSRRNLISNAANLVRAARGRGIIVSSEAHSALSLRGPFDIINLATFWGLNQERGRETVSENPRKVLVKAETRRGVHKGVLRITEQPEKTQSFKRPAPSTEENSAAGSSSQPLSKKQLKKMRKGNAMT